MSTSAQSVVRLYFVGVKIIQQERLWQPLLAVTGVSAHLYVSAMVLHGIYVFNITDNGSFTMHAENLTACNAKTALLQDTILIPSFGNIIYGLSADGNSKLLAVDILDKKVHKVDVSNPERCIENAKSCNDTILHTDNLPYSVIVDSTGNYWVFQEKSISIYDSEGKYLGKPIGDDFDKNDYNTAIIHRKNKVYYTDQSAGRVKMFEIVNASYDSNGKFSANIKHKLITTGSAMAELMGVAVDSNGYIFAARKAGISVFSPEGDYLDKIDWPHIGYLRGLYIDEKLSVLYATDYDQETLTVIAYK